MAEDREDWPWLKKLVLNAMYGKTAATIDAVSAYPRELMTPTVGRIIHVHQQINDAHNCRAAIVTGLDNLSSKTPTIYCTIFAPNLKPQEAVVYTEWHLANECPYTVA